MSTSFRPVALLATLAHLASAAPPPEVLVESGQQAGGEATGVLFSSFGTPVVNARGDVAFRAVVSGPGITTINDERIYLQQRGVAAKFFRLAAEGDVLAGGVFTIERLSPLLGPLGTQFGRGSLLVLGRVNGAGITAATDGVLLKLVPGQTPRIILQEGQPLGATGILIGPDALNPLDSNQSQALRTGDLDGDGKDEVIAFTPALTVDPGGPAVRALVTLVDEVPQLGPRVGDPMIGLTGTFSAIESFLVAGVTSGGSVFSASSSLGFRGIFAQPTDGPVVPLLLEGEAAPGLKKFEISSLLPPTMGANGSLIFEGAARRRVGEAVKNLAGAFRYDPATGKMKLGIPANGRAIAGVPQPGVYGAFFAALRNSHKDSVVHTEVAGGASAGEALVASQNDKPAKAFAYEGGPVPGFTDGSTLSEIHRVAVASEGVVWTGERLGTSTPTQTVLCETSLSGKKPATVLVLAEGQPTEFSPGGTRTVSNLIPLSGEPPGRGGATFFSNTGTAFLANFTGGGSGICFAPRQDSLPPKIQSDAQIKSGDTVLGDDIYEAEPDVQRNTITLERGQSGSLVVRVQNDSDEGYSMDLEIKLPLALSGPSSPGVLRLFDLSTDPPTEIIAELSSGKNVFKFRTDVIQPGEFADLRLDIAIPADFRGNAALREKLKIKTAIEQNQRVEGKDNYELLVVVPKP